MGNSWQNSEKQVEICTHAEDGENKEIHLKAKESEQLVIDAKLKPLPLGITRQELYYGGWFWIIPIKDQYDIHYVLRNMYTENDDMSLGYKSELWWDQIVKCTE